MIVILRWTDPQNIGMTSSTVLVHRSTNDYPDTIADGIPIYTGALQVYEDAFATIGQTNFYTIWVQNEFGWTNPPSD